jgi:hypothetical protein
VYPPFFTGPDKAPDSKDYTEQEENAAVDGAYIIGDFKLRNIKVSAPFPGNKAEITGHIQGIEQGQDTYAKGNDVEDHIPGQPVDRFTGIIEAEQGDECPYAGAGAGLYPISDKGRFQAWGNFFQKTAKGV